MRLNTFALQRYRSITKADLRLGPLTVLLGPNNEGKSNILHGLVAGMRILQRAARVPFRGRLSLSTNREDEYEWERDFPVSLKEASPDGTTLFDFEFELTSEEIADFKQDVGSYLTGVLPIRITVGPGTASFRVFRKGAGGPKLTEKRDQIAAFLGNRLHLQYIPSVRPARRAMEVVGDMVALEIAELEKSDEYQQAVAKIGNLQAPILATLADTIRDTLSDFLPDVSDVQLAIPSEARYGALRQSSTIMVDDGTTTDLRQKGDGVQSLAAISLIRYASERFASGKELVLAIEEPEAHLHPEAIHQLRPVLEEIAGKQQVVLTTHSPLLVNRHQVSANVIVAGSRARSAKSIEEVREVLGVRTADNLRSARIVLVVEGESDRRTLAATLAAESELVRSALVGGDMAIEPCHGVAHLLPTLTRLRNDLCLSHVFVDSDAPSIEACKRAEQAGLLAAKDRTLSTCPGLKESELEDLLDVARYEDFVRTTYNVNLKSPAFRSSKGKWTDRMAAVFKSEGQLWDEETPARLKREVSEIIEASPNAALHEKRRSAFDGLVSALHSKLAGTG